MPIKQKFLYLKKKIVQGCLKSTRRFYGVSFVTKGVGSHRHLHRLVAEELNSGAVLLFEKGRNLAIEKKADFYEEERVFCQKTANLKIDQAFFLNKSSTSHMSTIETRFFTTLMHIYAANSPLHICTAISAYSSAQTVTHTHAYIFDLINCIYIPFEYCSNYLQKCKIRGDICRAIQFAIPFMVEVFQFQ